MIKPKSYYVRTNFFKLRKEKQKYNEIAFFMSNTNMFIDLKKCTDEYITRFLRARKYRVEQTAALIAAYQAQIALRPDIFGNLTARDPAIQRALRAGIPGVLPARDR